MIGIIAVRGETTALLKAIKVEATIDRLQARFHRGRLAGRAVVLAKVGPGKVQTAAATQHLIDRYKVKLIISCGSAGALDPQLRVGDVVLATELIPHDAGIYLDNGFRHLGIYNNSRPDGLHYHRTLSTNPDLLATALHVAKNMTWPKNIPQIKTGNLVSGDQLIASRSKKRWLRDTFKALAVDTESAAVAQVTFLNGLPWLAIRAVSDSADSTLDFDLASFIIYSNEANNKLIAKIQQFGRKATKYAQKPARLKTMLGLRRGVQYASKNAAQVTTAIIAQLD